MGVFITDAEARSRITSDFVPEVPYQGTNRPWPGVWTLCGHRASPHACDITNNRYGCKICARNDATTAKVSFQDSIKAFGGEVVGTYKNTNSPVHCICPKGHNCYPHPNSIKAGHYMCQSCAHTIFDRLYVCASDDEVKFGVAGSSARVQRHKKEGLLLVAEWKNLEYRVVYTTEQSLIKDLRNKNISPTRGREYYDVEHLNYIREYLHTALT